ncbi:MFS transporter [Actinocorallia aurea]
MQHIRPYRWRWIALFVILAAEVMDLLDALVTAIAAPSIRADLGGGESTVQWLGAVYTLAMAVGLITGGRLGDIFGRRRMFLLGAAGFTLGSLACGLAAEPAQLIAARGFQGLLGAIMLPQGLAFLKEVFDEREQATAFSLFGPVMGLSTVGGPILAGWLLDADLWGTGWRMIFLINLPVGLFAVVGALMFLPAHAGERAVRLDLPGAALAAAGSGLVIYPLVQGREQGWPAWAFTLIALSVAVFGVFGWHEVRRGRRGGDPLVEPSLFRKRGFSGGLVMGLAFFSAMTGFSLTFSLYTQLGLHYSPLKSGLTGIPLSLGMVAAFGTAQALLRFGRRIMHAGIVISALGIGGLLFTIHHAVPLGPWDFAPALAVCGFGLGLVMAPFFDTVLASVEPHETGSASGTVTSVQQLGAALGTAILGTVFFDSLPISGYAGAEDATIAALLVMLAVVFAAVFLLPRHARPQEPQGVEAAPVPV